MFGVSFSPAASEKLSKRSVRPSRWTLHERSDKTLDDLRGCSTDIEAGSNYWAILQVGALPYPTAHRPDPGAMGTSEFKSCGAHRRAHSSGSHVSAATTIVVRPLGDATVDTAEQWSRMR